MTMRIGKVNYNPTDKTTDVPVYKQQQRRKLPPLLGNFQSVALPQTGYIPFADNSYTGATYNK